MLLYFDDPDDPAIDYLGKYDQVTCLKCDRQYWMRNKCSRPQHIEDRQIVNANNAFIYARIHQFDWIIHIDSDELIFPDVTTDRDIKGLNNAGVKGLLSHVPEDVHVVLFDIREAVPEKLHYNDVFKEITLFKVPPSEAQKKAIQSPEFEHILYFGEYFRGHNSSKSAVRLSSHIESMGLSSPKQRMASHSSNGSTNNMVIKEFRALKLLHFDCCDFATWKTKWVRRIDGTAVAAYMRPNRDRQLEEFRDMYTNHPEQLLELYKKMYFLTEGNKESLLKLGVLTYIKLGENLFDSPL